MKNRYAFWGPSAAALLLLASSAVAGPAAIRPGDGAARISAYNMMTKTVRIGTKEIQVSPQAAVSLERQLAGFGIYPDRGFGARFVVTKGASGESVITLISVYPPRQQKGDLSQ